MRLRDQFARLRRQFRGPSRDTAQLRSQQWRLHNEQLHQQEQLRVAVGALTARHAAVHASSFEKAEFRAFSQYGEDGIIEHLVRRCEIAPTRFVEIGVETYAEANTRFLAEHRLWSGLIVDLNPRLERDLARTKLNWRSQVRAVTSFITRDNVRGIVAPFVGDGGLGLLSVDIDGMDYWVVEQLIDVDAALVIVEYNSLFGDVTAVSVPYDAGFDRRRPEYHNVYYGASLAAFDELLRPRGYALVTTNTAGNNAFFVKSDRLREVPARTVTEAYRPRRFVEHRADDGTLTGIADPRRQLEDIATLPLVDVRSGGSLTVADVFPG